MALKTRKKVNHKRNQLAVKTLKNCGLLNDRLVIGAWYLFYLNYDGKRLDRGEIETDVRHMRESGIRCVYLTMMWADVAVVPGAYALEIADWIIKLAEKYGLKIIIGFIFDTAPAWIFEKYPNGRYVSENGTFLSESGGREIFGSPGLCQDNPAVANEVKTFMQAVVRRYKDSLAMYAWDAWAETWFDPCVTGGTEKQANFCYCEYTIDSFRRWLQQRYASLENLNATWGSRFLTWQSVTPPRGDHRTVAAWLDWKRFLIASQAERLRRLVNNIREIDAAHPIMDHSGISSVASKGKRDFGSMPATTLIDDWKMAPNLDLCGVSIYPSHPYSYENIAARKAKEIAEDDRQATEERKMVDLDLDVARNLDCTRSAAAAYNRRFLVAELPGLLGGGYLRPATDKNYLQTQQIWSWMALTRQSTGVIVYEWRDIVESLFTPGWGLCDYDGKATERSRAFGALIKDIEKVEGLLARAEPEKPQIGILFNPLAYLYDWVQGRSCGRDALLGYYKAFWFANYPVDFVHSDELDKPLDYRVLYIPYPVILDEKACANIKRYIEAGGKVVTEALFAGKDENGVIRRRAAGKIWTDCFCCNFGDKVAQSAITLNANAGKCLSILKGVKLPTAVCAQIIEPFAGGQTIGEYPDHSPSIVLGKNTIVAGSFLGCAYDETEDKNLEKFIIGTARWAGIRPLVEMESVAGERCYVEARVFQGDGYLLCFAINHSPKALDFSGKLNLPVNNYTVREILRQRPCNFTRRKDYVQITSKIEGREVLVFLVETE